MPKHTPSTNCQASALHAARYLMRQGIQVVPCEGKKPIIAGWPNKQMTLEQVEELLTRRPHLNTAIVLNQSDVIDVECDSDEAEEALRQMFAGRMPTTPTWQSKRGKHRLFTRPLGLPEVAKLELDSVEFRVGNGKGALSLVPPSVTDDFKRVWLPGLAIPVPTRGGGVADLRPFVNVTDEDWPLVLAWLVNALRPCGPYPVLKLIGEQGSAKSTTARVLRALVDPNACSTRGAPKTDRDLMIAAENGWVCAFDNLSYVTPELSDALCRLSTGGGFGVRTHYENAAETVFYSKRPIILNGIEDVGTRSDLLDRCLVVELPRLPDRNRKPERVFDRLFEKKQPRILGALLDTVSAALRNLPAVERRTDVVWPRMADFAQWGTAAERALDLEPGGFLAVYDANRTNANQAALDSSPVADALLELLKGRPERTFKGTATELLTFLTIGLGRDRRQPGWPKSPRVLSSVLQRLAPNLRRAGLHIELAKESNQKVWTIVGPREVNAGTHGTQSTQKPKPKITPTHDRYGRPLKPTS